MLVRIVALGKMVSGNAETTLYNLRKNKKKCVLLRAGSAAQMNGLQKRMGTAALVLSSLAYLTTTAFSMEALVLSKQVAVVRIKMGL